MPAACRPFPPVAALVLAVVVTFAGCAPAPAPSAKPAASAGHGHAHEHGDHGHGHGDHDHGQPDTLAAGIDRLTKAAAAVKDRLAAGDRDAADDAVHDMAHQLEDLQALVRKSTLATEAKAAATKALDDLFECFDKLDTALHAEPGKGDSPSEVHASVATRIEAAIAGLRDAGTTKEN